MNVGNNHNDNAVAEDENTNGRKFRWHKKDDKALVSWAEENYTLITTTTTANWSKELKKDSSLLVSKSASSIAARWALLVEKYKNIRRDLDQSGYGVKRDTPNPSISAETLERFPKYHRMDALLRYRRNIDPPGGTPLTTRLIAPGYLDFLHSTRNNNDNNADSDGSLDNDAHEGRRGLDSGSDEETPHYGFKRCQDLYQHSTVCCYQ